MDVAKCRVVFCSAVHGYALSAIQRAQRDVDALVYWDEAFWMRTSIISNIQHTINNIQPLQHLNTSIHQERPKVQSTITKHTITTTAQSSIDKFFVSRLGKHIEEENDARVAAERVIRLLKAASKQLPQFVLAVFLKSVGTWCTAARFGDKILALLAVAKLQATG